MKSTIRDVILEYIMSINGSVSGKEVAEIAHCSPRNISYHIAKLRKEGMDIEVSHRGYRYKRECDAGLINLKEGFIKAGIIFEYVRSCLKIVCLHNEKRDKRGIYYTFNEVAFFSGSGAGNLSFLINLQDEYYVKDYIVEFLGGYIGSNVMIEDVGNFILSDDYIIGRYSRQDNAEHFQLIVNNKAIRNIGEMEVRSIADIFGDNIGIKGFSVLIFENLYEKLLH
ncbi:MAG: HTH domain-containing protein [Myxococcota bacterium]